MYTQENVIECMYVHMYVCMCKYDRFRIKNKKKKNATHFEKKSTRQSNIKGKKNPTQSNTIKEQEKKSFQVNHQLFTN